jgi:hypothetical protein
MDEGNKKDGLGTEFSKSADTPRDEWGRMSASGFSSAAS